MADTINAKVEWLEDSAGKVIVPYTHVGAVFNSSGSTLEGLLADYDTVMGKTEEELKGYYVEASVLKRFINKGFLPEIYFATCSTASNIAAKEVVIADESNWELRTGVSVVVKFTNSNTASSCTINVNDTGAKQIYYSESIFTDSADYVCGRANHYIRYIYDGTYWVWMGHCSDEVGNAGDYLPLSGGILTGALTIKGGAGLSIKDPDDASVGIDVSANEIIIASADASAHLLLDEDNDCFKFKTSASEVDFRSTSEDEPLIPIAVGSPIADDSAATKKYVDDTIRTALSSVWTVVDTGEDQ